MANAQLGSKAVDSIVKLKVNGTATEFIVVHQGKPSSIYDESCNGTWLLMKDIYEDRQWHTTNIREYQYSAIHNYLNGTFFNLFDENIRGSIKQVKIPYLDTPDFLGTIAIKSGANGLPCKIFPLSGYEVGWTEEDGRFWADGAKLDYFAAGTGTSANSKRIAKLNGSAANWWLRSPYTTNKDTVWYVSQNGSYSNDTVTMMCGIRPALVLPQDMEVDSSGNVVMPIGTHKTLVNGTVYEVKGGKCLVNGTSYDIKKGRTLINGTGYDITFAPSYDPVFSNNTWEQIIEACHNNAVPDTWKVADQKPMTINGVDYLIDIIGKNHDDYSDGSGKAPLTFQLHDCYGTKYQMNSSNTNTSGWTGCAMRSTHLPAILALMPSEVQAGIKEVNKLTSAGSQSSTINTTADKLFLLSEIEIFGRRTYSKSGEGSQYAYYSAGNSKVKNFSGSANYWWERSPSSSTYFCGVTSTGTAYYYNASNSTGVAFGFCF